MVISNGGKLVFLTTKTLSLISTNDERYFLIPWCLHSYIFYHTSISNVVCFVNQNLTESQCSPKNLCS